MTNGDRIREMTDEELADFIHNVETIHDKKADEYKLVVIDIDTGEEYEIGDNIHDIKKWLEEEI